MGKGRKDSTIGSTGQRAPTTDPFAPTARATTLHSSTPGYAYGPASSSPIAMGDLLGERYEVLTELGRGGQAAVFLARDRSADAVVALKLLNADSHSQGRLSRFRRELSLARKVTHPNVVRIYDLVELPGRFGLSMEFVEGETLSDRLERGEVLTAEEVTRLAGDLAEGLAAAHNAGVTHRDLKPSNILLRAARLGGGAVVTDFGVSRLHGADEGGPVASGASWSDPSAPGAGAGPSSAKLTMEGAIIGTPLYMSPEQLEGSSVGPAADVYAFGLVVFEAATGKRPHDGSTLAKLREARLAARVPPLAATRPELPARLWAVVDRCLERRASDRYASGIELRAALLGDPLSPVRASVTGLSSLSPMMRDLTTGRDAPVSTQLLGGEYQNLAFSRDGKRLAMGRGPHGVIEVDLASGAIVREFAVGNDQIQQIVFTDQEELVIRNQFLGDLWMADVSEGH